MTTARRLDVDEGWPFVGRETDLEWVRRRIVERGRSVVLAGPMGVGKTRLGVEVLEAAAGCGLATAQVTGTRAASGIPFGAVAGLLPAFDGQQAGAVDDRADWINRCVSALASYGGDRPLVLLVDDVQLLDAASATMLHQAVVGDACRMLATLRIGEPVPDAVVALWRDGTADRLDLLGMGEDEIARLLTRSLGGPVDRATVARLTDQCEGNVLFLRELVRGARRAGVLVDTDHLWRLVGPAPLSDRLAELVEVRLADLSTRERDLLELVAYGQPLGPAELRALGGLELAEDLERRGFLASRRDGRRLQVRLPHPLYGEVLLSRVPALKMQRMSRTLADTVEATGARRRDDVLRLATWRLDGGGARPELMLRAAATARWAYDFPLAERLARAARDDGAGLEAGLLAAQLAYLQGRGLEAERELAGLAASACDDEERGRVALARLECAIFLGHIDDGLRIAVEAERLITEQGWRDQVTARRAGLLLAAEGPRAAAEVAVPLMRRSHGRALVWACLAASIALGRLGRLGEAIAAADAGYAAQLALPASLEYYPWLHAYFRGDALIYSGSLEQASEAAGERYETAVRERSSEARAYFGFQLAKPVGERGDVAVAVRHAREAGLLFRDLGRPAMLEPCLVDLVVSLALSGDADEAGRALAELERLPLSASYYSVEVLRARAWEAVARGSLARARELLEAGAGLGEQIGDVVGALEALHTLARLGRARSALEAAARIAARVEGPLAAARLAHIQALAGGSFEDLNSVTGMFESLGAHLLAAEAATEAAAVAARKHASTQRIAVLRRRAASLRERCPDAVTPTLHGGVARSELTHAEADAAMLAAEGRSNREIAEKLHISVRTVEGQLQRSYEKLGIAGRSELAAALHGRTR